MIEIKCINDLETARTLWQTLSPQKSLFDDWAFRYCFYKYQPYPLFFYAAFDNEIDPEQPVALLPLQLESTGYFKFFAEEPCEENRVFVKAGYEYLIPQLYQLIDRPARCYDISGEDEFTKSLPLEDYKYVLPLTGMKNFSDYMKICLSLKKQRNWRSDLRKVENQIIEVIYNNQADLKKLFVLNNQNFSDSYLQSNQDQGFWSDLLDLYNCQIVSVKVGGEVLAVSLSIVFNGIYFYLINGVDSKKVSGLGKYLNKLNIEKAIELSCDYFDAGLGDCNWKKAWHFDPVPQYEFVREGN